ncbi:MBL fold metallo-hydrolase [Fulvivirgaceae bacterium BMA12]|uniref:MBL fold metallo-hydrolase n=1 Tax=Agaribacillus aureus TaxID=3051825 RepID=A0ABT8LEG0_9BACT|nr:MBL fold metallo-hydrolase [Fulvivirgaceae bacterium BMA12]
MKLKFCGAARTVTGSSHLLTLDDGYKILFDCGLYQGREDGYEDFNRQWHFEPSEIDCLILSHAHIDHIGRVPALVKDGFDGNIICTSATRDLAAIMLLDSAFIQEKDVQYVNKRRVKEGKTPLEPLYTAIDAKKCLDNFVGIAYNRWFQINEQISVLFKDGGHILGSSNVTLRIKTKGSQEKIIGFTGDIGRPDRPILKDPTPMPPCDYLICESTYGGEEHNDRPNDEHELLKIIEETCVKNKGKLLIPAFSVGRTQELVYMMDKLESSGKLPKIPVFVDSPLAVNATEIFILHPECYDDDLLEYMDTDPNPFGFGNLNYVRKAEDSKKLNDLAGPAIIISASGMMSAGRIKHHLFNHIENASNTILVVGFCSPGTLGERIRNRPPTVRIFGVEKSLKAQVRILDSFSAHGDEREMLDFLRTQHAGKLQKIFLVHGEITRQEKFKDALLEEGFKNVMIPSLGEEIDLT